MSPMAVERSGRFSAAVSAEGASLTAAGRAFWVTRGDLCPGLCLGQMVRWPAMAGAHPEVMAVPVRVAVPGPGDGWARSAVRARFRHIPPPGRFEPGSEILLNPVTCDYPSPADLLRALAHEAAHLAQAKEGRWCADSVHSTPGYARSGIEAEARAVADSVGPAR